MSAIADLKMNSIPSFIIDPPTAALLRAESNFPGFQAPVATQGLNKGHQSAKLDHLNNNYKKKLLLAAAISNHSLLHDMADCSSPPPRSTTHTAHTTTNLDDLSSHQQAGCNQDNSISTTKSPQNSSLKRVHEDDDPSPGPKKLASFGRSSSSILPNSPSLTHNGPPPLIASETQSDWLNNYRVATLASPTSSKSDNFYTASPASPSGDEIIPSKPLDLALRNKITDLRNIHNNTKADPKADEESSIAMKNAEFGLDFPQFPILNSSPRLIQKAKRYWKEFISKVLDATKEEEEQQSTAAPFVNGHERFANKNHHQTASLINNSSPNTLTSSTAPPSLACSLVNTTPIKKLLASRLPNSPASPGPDAHQVLVTNGRQTFHESSSSPSTNTPKSRVPTGQQVKFQEDNLQPQSIAHHPMAEQQLMHPLVANAALYYYQQQQQQQYLMSMFQQQHNLLDPNALAASGYMGKDFASTLYPSSLLASNPYYYMLGHLGLNDTLSSFPPQYQPTFDPKLLQHYSDLGSGTSRAACKNTPSQQQQHHRQLHNSQYNHTPTNPVATSTALPATCNKYLQANNVLHAHLTKNTVAQKLQKQPSYYDYHRDDVPRTAMKLSPADDSLSHLSSTFSGGPYSNKSSSSPSGDEKYAEMECGGRTAKQDPNTSPNDVLTNDSAVDLTFNEEEGHRKSNSSSKDSYLDCGEALNLCKKREVSALPEKDSFTKHHYPQNSKITNVMTTMGVDDDSAFVSKSAKMDALSALEKDKLEALALYNKLAEISPNEGVMTDADKNVVRQWNGTEDFLWEDVKYRRKSFSSTSFYHPHNNLRNSAATGSKGHADPNGLARGENEDQQDQFGNNPFSLYDLDDENEMDDCKSYQTQYGRPCNKDQRMALALSLPFSIEDIVTSPIDSFSEILRKADLSVEQIGLVRDIRRRGKNKIAAQNCRKRKLDLIMYLGKNVDYLKATRGALLEERDELEKEIIDYHIKLENLYLETFKSSGANKESAGTAAESLIIPENYMFQFVDKSKGNLIPQKSTLPAYTFTWGIKM